jgi:hypothetical protein
MPDLPRQGDRQGDYEPGPLALLLLWPLALVLIALLFPVLFFYKAFIGPPPYDRNPDKE